MSKSYRIVAQTTPWFNKEEFEAVRKSLFSGNLFEMRWAVDRIAVWESRCHPVLDIGIDATAAIIRATIQDILYETNTSLCQPSDLQAMYSLSLIRFVNIISEVAKSTKEGTLRDAALKMGIPEWIVYLRNNATHGRTPPIGLLRTGASYVSHWLQENFWQKEISIFADFTKLRDVASTNIVDVVSSFQNCQYEVLFTDQVSNQTKTMQQIKLILSAMTKLIENQRKEFLEVLLQSGFFFPSVQDLTEILKHRNETSFIDNKTMNLPSTLKDFWAPLITLIVDKNYIQEFVEALFKSLSQKDSMRQKVAACWIYYIIKNDDDEDVEGHPFGEVSEHDRPSFNWVRLLGACLQNCCEYTPGLLPVIVEHIDPPINDEKKCFIMALVAVYLGATTAPPDSKSKIEKVLFTVDGMKIDLKMREEKKDADNIWHKAPENINWASLPLGYVFTSQQEFTTNILPKVIEDTKDGVESEMVAEEMLVDTPEMLVDTPEMLVDTPEEKVLDTTDVTRVAAPEEVVEEDPVVDNYDCRPKASMDFLNIYPVFKTGL